MEITGDYLVFLSQSYTLIQLLLPSTELRESIPPCIIQVGDLDPTRVTAQFIQAAMNKGCPLRVYGLKRVLLVLEVLLKVLGWRWQDKKVAYEVDTPRQ